MLDFLWDLRQDQRIREATGGAQRAEGKALNVESQARSLERQVDALVLLNQALVELLNERLGVTEEEILARVAEVDLRDGNRDGRVAGVVACAECNRPYSHRLNRCIYCGYVSAGGPIANRVRPVPGSAGEG